MGAMNTILFGLAMIASAPAFADWQWTHWGMTPEEVVAASYGSAKLDSHYLEVACGCGTRRVIGVGRMTEDPRIGMITLATVAAKVQCTAFPSVPILRTVQSGVASVSGR
jgi:hypothetical protein